LRAGKVYIDCAVLIEKLSPVTHYGVDTMTQEMTSIGDHIIQTKLSQIKQVLTLFGEWIGERELRRVLADHL
jgi:hypothetical protein